MIRFAILLLTRSWGWILIGVALLIGGAIYGVTSHQVTYQSVTRGEFQVFILSGGTDYIEVNHDASTYYAINESNFSPSLTSSALPDNGSIAFVYKTDDGNVNENLSDGTTISGTSHDVVQLTVADGNGQNQHVYNTSEYTQHPQGYYANNWPLALVIMVAGLVLGGVAFVVSSVRKRSKVQPAGFGAPGMSMNPAMGTQPPVNPYQQPYQNPNQYGQYGQYGNAPQYPQQPSDPYRPGPNQQPGGFYTPPQQE